VSSERRQQLGFAVVCAATFIVVLDAAIMNVALPSIQKALGMSETNLQWVVNAYTLIFGGFLLLGGRCADLFGRRKVFMAGLAIFGLASGAGGFAQNSGWLIVARGFEGFGAALIAPSALAILYTMFSEEGARHRAVGIYGAMGSGGAASGALLGGVLTQYLGWEWCLFVNVPITALAVVLSPLVVPEGRPEGVRKKLDVGGALTMTGSLLLLVYAVVQVHGSGWGSARTIGCLVGSAVLLASFVIVEKRSRSPLIPLDVFKVRSLRGANVVAGCMTAAMFAQFYFTTLYMQQVLGLSAIVTGLAFTPLSVVTAASSIFISRVLRRLSVQHVLAGVMATMAIGLALLTRVSADGTYWEILGPLLLVAASFGVALVALTIAALSGLEAGDTGLGSGLLNTSRRVSGAIGLAVMSTVAASKTDAMLANGQSMAVALNDGFRWAYGIGAAVALAGAIAAVVMLRGRLSEAGAVVAAE